jgi:hypothetical protein
VTDALESLLAHKNAMRHEGAAAILNGGMDQAYDRSSRLKGRAALVQGWADWLDSVTGAQPAQRPALALVASSGPAKLLKAA